jgi:hypothetical protein
LKIVAKLALQKGIALLLLLVLSMSSQARELEPVLIISAENAEILLADNPMEDVMFIPHTVAAQLLGDEPLDDTVLNIDDINGLPSTAAGNEEIVYISAEAAEKLLGE